MFAERRDLEPTQRAHTIVSVVETAPPTAMTEASLTWVWKCWPFVVALVVIAATLILRARKNAKKDKNDRAQKGNAEDRPAAAVKQQEKVPDKLEKPAKRKEKLEKPKKKQAAAIEAQGSTPTVAANERDFKRKAAEHVRKHTVPDDQAIAAACSPELQADPQGDGDQSPLRPGYHGESLYQMWARGGNLNELWSTPQQFSQFFVACAHGQLEAVQAGILNEAGADRHRLLETRESNLRYSPVHMTVAGARMHDIEPYKVRAWSPDYLGVMRALLAAGARTEAKDIMGHTPMALATNSYSTPTSLRVARVLAEHGASMRATTRMGMTLLFGAAVARTANLDSIRLLLELGADPKQPAYGGGDLAWVLKAQPASSGKDAALALLAAHAAKTSNHALVGKTVALHGLSASPELNGCQGQAVSWVAASSRIEVKLFGRQKTLSLKPANLSAMPAERQQFVPATAVTITDLESRPELNGRIALIQGFAEGRYAVAVKQDEAPALRIRLKPDNMQVALPADAACLLDQITLVQGLDLRLCKPWPGLSCGATVLSKSEIDATGAREMDIVPQGALKTCFVCAVPSMAREALKGTLEETLGGAAYNEAAHDENAVAANLAPFAQWAYSLFHIADLYEKPDSAVFRFLVGQEMEGECLIIDVLSGPLACPQHLEVHRTQWGAIAQQAEGKAVCEPLLPIRYWHVPQDDERHHQRDRAVLAAERCPVTRKAMAAKGLDPATHAGPRSTMLIRTSSRHEIGAALANLQANERLLSPDFREQFYQASAVHSEIDGKGFRCSFLAPPLPPKIPPKREHQLCAGCNQTTKEVGCSAFMACGDCDSYYYCSKACAKNHWKKEHKQECKISAEAVRERDSSSARLSVVFSTLPPPELVGQCQVTISHVTGQSILNGVASSKLNPDRQEDYKPIQNKPAKNVHGSQSFIVKVQPPCSRTVPGQGPHGFAGRGEHKGSAWACTVYDEARSFTAYLPMDEPGIDPLLALIRKDGIQAPNGAMKAYCEAVRVGPNLRIFADTLLPRQQW